MLAAKIRVSTFRWMVVTIGSSESAAWMINWSNTTAQATTSLLSKISCVVQAANNSILSWLLTRSHWEYTLRNQKHCTWVRHLGYISATIMASPGIKIPNWVGGGLTISVLIPIIP